MYLIVVFVILFDGDVVFKKVDYYIFLKMCVFFINKCYNGVVKFVFDIKYFFSLMC